MSTYFRSRRSSEASSPSMMCFRDKPWLLTRTSPLAPPQFNFSKSVKFFLVDQNACLGANDNVISFPLVLLDCLTHDDLGLATCIATSNQTPATTSTSVCYLSAVSKKLIPQSYACFMHSNVRSSKCRQRSLPAPILNDARTHHFPHGPQI